MSRIRQSVSALILPVLAMILITSCSSSKEATEKTTTTEAESLIFMTHDCPKDAGFCVDFPSSHEDEATKVSHPADSSKPAHTSYVTEVYPGMETEQYVVNVFDDDAEGKAMKQLLATYDNPSWKCVQDQQIALMTCTHRMGGELPSTDVDMLVAGEDKLYLVQASTMSKNDPTYLSEFIGSFELTTT